MLHHEKISCRVLCRVRLSARAQRCIKDFKYRIDFVDESHLVQTIPPSAVFHPPLPTSPAEPIAFIAASVVVVVVIEAS